jgi:hypothetical protein
MKGGKGGRERKIWGGEGGEIFNVNKNARVFLFLIMHACYFDFNFF